MSTNKILYAALVVVTMITACAEQNSETYNIQGTSSVSVLDGSKLYLKVLTGGELKNIDSCEVIHGDFGFTGQFDSTRLAMLSIRDGGMPMVIERGDIKVSIDKTGNKVSGTPLNEKLYDYIDKHIQLENLRQELGHKEAQMIFEGIDERTISKKLMAEEDLLLVRKDSLETAFILGNMDNVLGPCAFQMLTINYPYPQLTPQIEEIMAKASDQFKNDPYVKEYYSKAKEIMARLRGEIQDEPVATAEPSAE